MADYYKIKMSEREQFTGQQGTTLRVMVSEETVPGAPFSWLDVTLSGGGMTNPHVHEHSPISIRLIDGHAATLVGENMTPVLHDARDQIYIPAGVPHCAVNLSGSHPVIGFEVRTDPQGDKDVVLRPDLVELAGIRADELRAEFADKLVQARISGRAPW